MSFVQIDGVSKRFGDLEVLRDVSLHVEEHGVVCLIGASGSGKSTLLRCINVLERIDAGRISVDGLELTNGKIDVNALRRKIGIVFQAYNLFPHMTVLENVTLAPKKARGMSSRDARRRALELLAQIGLDDVCFLDAGVICEEGDPERIFSAPEQARTREFLARVIEAGRL